MGSPITKAVMSEEDVVGAFAERPTLRPADRCDRCGAQAFVAAHHPSGTLVFCGHHFAKNEPGLIAQGFEIQDERHLINDNPSVSANAE